MEEQTRKKQTFRYYSRMRPIGPGTCPKKGLQEVYNFDSRKYVEDAGTFVWGHIDYDRELTEREIAAYELTAGGKGQQGGEA